MVYEHSIYFTVIFNLTILSFHCNFAANKTKVLYGMQPEPDLGITLDDDNEEEEDKDKPKVEYTINLFIEKDTYNWSLENKVLSIV